MQLLWYIVILVFGILTGLWLRTAHCGKTINPAPILSVFAVLVLTETRETTEWIKDAVEIVVR